MILIQSHMNMKNCLPNLWDNVETLFAEVVIESECDINFMPTHGIETGKVYEAEFAAIGG